MKPREPNQVRVGGREASRTAPRTRPLAARGQRRGPPGAFLEPLPRFRSHLVGIYGQKLTKSPGNDFWLRMMWTLGYISGWLLVWRVWGHVERYVPPPGRVLSQRGVSDADRPVSFALKLTIFYNEPSMST